MNKRSFLVFIASIVGLIFVFGDTLYVCAQEASKEEFTLEEITVTAQKRQENQQKVAISMQTIVGEEMAELGKTSLETILENIPDAVIVKAADGLRISLRGMSDTTQTFHNQSLSAPTVAVNMDGVFSNRKDQGADLYDLERVEVLYGPQSTLYASNSPGGVVNVVSANPKLDKFSTSGSLEYGNYNLLHIQGTLNAPISSTVALRGSFSIAKHDGYLSNGGEDQDVKSGRLKFLYQPVEKLSFVVTGSIEKDGGAGRGGGSVDSFVKQSDRKDPWIATGALGSPQDITTKKISGNISWDLDFATLTVIPSYSKRNGSQSETVTAQGNSNITYDDETTMNTTEKSLELRMASASDFFFKWIAGFNYYKSEDYQEMMEYYNGAYNEVFRKNMRNENQKAFFANVTYPITSTFRTTGGYRLNWDDLENMRQENTTVGKAVTEAATPTKANYDKRPDYMVGVEYDLGASAMLYADYKTSFMTQGEGGGGGPGGGSSTTTPPPQKLNAYSVGSKNRFLDNKLQVNASAFYNIYQNFPAQSQVWVWEGTGDPYDTTLYPNGPQSDLVNGDPNGSSYGNGHMYGVDLSTNIVITSKDKVDLSISYLKSEWTSLTFNYKYKWQIIGSYMPAPPGNTSDTVGVTVGPLSALTLNGQSMMNSPKITANLIYRHDFSLWNGGDLRTQVDGRYKSSYKLTWKAEDYPYNYQEAYIKANFSAIYTHPNGIWTLTGYVRNIFKYADKTGYMGQPMYQTMIGDPRTYGGVLSVKF